MGVTYSKQAFTFTLLHAIIITCKTWIVLKITVIVSVDHLYGLALVCVYCV